MTTWLTIKKLVVYIGTTWLHSNGTEYQCQSSDQILIMTKSHHQNIIMIHAGSENGFISRAQADWKADSKGDRCYRINEETFDKWDHLLPNIPSNSIIVMN